MKIKIKIVGIILILSILTISGCLEIAEIDNSITYESHPTSLLFTISYGYRINCSGSGNYEIRYDCDDPEVLLGSVLSVDIHDSSYIIKNLATFNRLYSWFIESDKNRNYNLGITAEVSTNSYMIPDLNGKEAINIEDIETNHPDIFAQYTKSQSNDTIVFIDPENQDIKDISTNINDITQSKNSLIIAKELFKWLKQNTEYKTQTRSNYVQPCIKTLDLKTGDCDDLSFLYISLCRSIGIPARFIRGFIIDKDTAIPHAWAEIFVGKEVGNNGWIPVECAGTSQNIDIEVNQNFGIESADHLRLFMDDGSNESLKVSLSGLSYVTYGNRFIDPEAFVEIDSYSVAKSNKLTINDNGYRSYN
jgi:hypothetical protein